MAILSDNSSVRSQILPSVWAGYTLPRSQIMGEELPSEGMISSKENIPQEWLDGLMKAFQIDSSASFYDKYLGGVLNERNHEQILLESNKILKQDVQELTPTDNLLIAIMGMDVAHNADEYGHHLFQTACFLKEQNQLPKECRFMFWRKINPALYEEKDQFEQVEKSLSELTQKVPHKWAENAFYRWVHTDDSTAYLTQMIKMAAFEFLLAEKGMMPLERAVRNYIHEHHEPSYQRRLHLRRRNWRAYGE